MPRKRTPIAVAEITGQTLEHPSRFADRVEPTAQALGGPPDSLSEAERIAWLELAGDMPWLVKSDRHLVELASRLMVRTTQPDCPLGVFTQMRLCLGSMGATPTDRTRVEWNMDDDIDPASEFLN